MNLTPAVTVAPVATPQQAEDKETSAAEDSPYN